MIMNDNNKRSRPKEFLFKNNDYNDKKMTLFEESQKFKINRIKPFGCQSPILPDYIKMKFNVKKSPSETHEEFQKKYLKWKYEQKKEELRQIIRLNKFYDKKALEDEEKINKYLEFKCFVIGKRKKNVGIKKFF